ncbi:hypothetical protein HN784_03510 [bacterium]|jgi:hypothetical protein|nr:hypothetical protein [bacterium]MBT4251363.1 hypothetical protein [bacterium]MBT4598256.1 hypothetical protein [bacterium]MBT6754089.1 hypothetical protein [bacterium]MBT7037909.1 hypothetical protein [bacterium]
MYEIKRIDIRSAVKVGAVILLGLALICPPVIALIIGFIEEVVFSSSPDLLDIFEYLFDDDFWEFYIPFVPIATIGGLVIGATVSFVYNLLCERIGGLKIEILFQENQQNNVNNMAQTAPEKVEGEATQK